MAEGGWMEAVKKEIGRLTEILIQSQQPDGRWSFCFETGVMTDAYAIILYRFFGRREDYVQEQAERLMRLRGSDGLWRLYPDEKEGNLSSTIEASLSLMVAGRIDPNGQDIRQIQEWVRSRGGLSQAGSLTKVVLALLKLKKWSDLQSVPIELLLLPRWFPVNFWDLVGYARVHAAPVMVAAEQQFTVQIPGLPTNMADWGEAARTADENKRTMALAGIVGDWLRPHGPRSRLSKLALGYGEKFMLERLESDGTLYSYFSTTFLMMFGLMSLGYPKKHPVLQKALQGVEGFLYKTPSGLHMQENTSTIWDTALIAGALQESGVPSGHPALCKAATYLLSRQQDRIGDWALKNPGVPPGGWGFSDINTINPDCDDTAAVLRVLSPFVTTNFSTIGDSWYRGTTWLLSMQNRDGGWPAFEKNTAKRWPLKFMHKDAASAWTDPSTADLTGRILYFLGKTHCNYTNPAVSRALNFLYRDQEKEGYWFGRWGIAYLYGTWAALTGMSAVGISKEHPSVARAVKWLLSVQNEDGGWGESCRSDVEQRFVPLSASTPSQTAWALDALIAVSNTPTPAIQAGVRRLLAFFSKEKSESSEYPTGAGLAGQFYIHYHSYRYAWPLMALAHYRQKFGGNKD
ncbi:sporulenol synthase [Marininema mesophilum]|uniref:Sporulenol synthase n=1 Tax=Marininema mesophilum TaxID=1048340 RepID=A0A1H2S2Q5_9BACL|nr:prenyltransferase/squalene oxidase repeat-containing protein [Marininema mesophilum]SDW25891.1 sporulenol synthase [Marininema mesophilum]